MGAAIKISAIISLSLLCAACGDKNVDETNVGGPVTATSSEMEAEPRQLAALPTTEADLFKSLLEIAHIKDDGLPLSRKDDGFTGGEAARGTYSNGMIDFYTMPDGRLWKVRVTSGIADKCGDAIDQGAIERFIRLSTPEADAASISATLAPAIDSGGIEQVHVGSLRYTAAGDCRQSIDVTELNALPPEKRPD